LAKFFIPSTLYDNGAGRPGTNSPQTSLGNLVDSEINYINYIWHIGGGLKILVSLMRAYIKSITSFCAL